MTHRISAIVRVLALGVVLASALLATSMDQSSRLAVGIIVGLPSFVLMTISRRQLGKSFSVMPEARALVTTGLYSRIQHPMYVFLDLFLVSLIVALGWPVLLFGWAIVVVLQILQGRREEKVLAVSFGSDYETYRSQTWL